MPGPGEFDDLNEAVASEWVDGTTPRERVREVIATEYNPVSAEDIADTARIPTKTATEHLDVLASDGFVTVESTESGDSVYRRSAESLVVEQATDILDTVSTDELTARVSGMRERVEELKDAHGVESLEATADREDIDSETVREWEQTRRNLAFANAALVINNASRVIDDTRGY